MKRVKCKYFYKLYFLSVKMNIEQLQYNSYTIKRDSTRHDKLFNDYKEKQKMLNILQQRYLYKEGEKYTFCPIINNYIIKYKDLNYPISTNRDYSIENSPIKQRNYNAMNNFKEFFQMKNNKNTISPYANDNNISYSTKNEPNIYGILKTLKNKNMFLYSIDNKSKNKINKKKDNNLSNSNKSKKKTQRYQNNSNCLKNDFRTNSYDELNFENKCQKGRNQYKNYSEKYKKIQEANSIKTLFSNKSHLSNKNNYKKCGNTNNIRKKYKDKDKNIIQAKLRREKSDDSKKNISNISSISDEKYLLNENNMNLSNINYSNIYLRNKYQRNRNIYDNYYYNYDNYSNQTNIDKTVSLKHLIQNEKTKNNSKPKKHSNFNDKKANKLIDSIFNNKNINIYNIKTNNSLMIKTNDIININFNENLKNMRIKSENYTSKLQDFPILLNKRIENNNFINTMNCNYTENKINVSNNFKENESKGKKINRDILRSYLALDKKKNQKFKSNEFNQENKKLNYKKIINKNIKKNQINKLNNKNKTNAFILDNNIDKAKQESYRRMKNKNKPKLFSIDESNKYAFNTNENNEIANRRNNYIDISIKNSKITALSEDKTISNEGDKMAFTLKKKQKKYDGIYVKKNNNAKNNINNNNNNNQIKIIEPLKENKNENVIENKISYKINNHNNNELNYNTQSKLSNEEDKDLSFQSLSDSKVLEIANIYVDEHVDKSHVNGILTYKKRQSHIQYYDN